MSDHRIQVRGDFRMKDGQYVNICPYYREL